MKFGSLSFTESEILFALMVRVRFYKFVTCTELPQTAEYNREYKSHSQLQHFYTTGFPMFNQCKQ